jgi:hypothetical protein
MRAESWKNGLEALSIVLPHITRQLARAGVFAALVWRHGEHVVARTQLGKTLREQGIQLQRRQIGFYTSLGTIEAHIDNFLEI